MGKTLTGISLILKSVQADEEREDESDESDEEEDEGWKARGRKNLHYGGKQFVFYINCQLRAFLSQEHSLSALPR